MKYIPQLTAPDKSNKYFYSDNIFYQSGFGMPNCTAYAYGNFYQNLARLGIAGKPKLCTRNAENWYNYNDGYPRGKTPKLGAIAVWSQGIIGNEKDGAGHVAVVEEIKADGSILVSDSAYKGANFRLVNYPNNYYKAGFKFEGFIYLPIDFESNTPEPTPTPAPSNDLKIGDKVLVLSGVATADSYGGGSKTSPYNGDINDSSNIRYITSITDLSRPRPYHISVGNTLGNGDRGWVSKEQIKKID